MMMVLFMNYTYIVKCSDGSLYTGWTNDLEKRIRAHNEGKGAKYTKSRRPVVLAYYEEFQTKEEAMRREWEIKQMSRQKQCLASVYKGQHAPSRVISAIFCVILNRRTRDVCGGKVTQKKPESALQRPYCPLVH